MHPIFENILRGFSPHVPRPEAESVPYLDALEPRTCACGEPTGSVALDTCEECEGQERAAREAGLAMEDTCRRSIRDATVDHARSVADLYDERGEVQP